jgi:uncharacterized protein
MKRLRVLLTATIAAMVALLALAAPALAHVTVSAPGAKAGSSDQEIDFRVPVEEKANTVGVTVFFPQQHPIASVDVQPIAGWHNTEKSVKLKKPIKTDDGDITTAVARVTWTAQHGNGLRPGDAGIFTVLAGQLPSTRRLIFKAVQRYSNGTTVRWDQQAAPGSNADPQHPAPVLRLQHGSAAASSSSSSSFTFDGQTILSIAAIVVAAIALGVAVVSRAKKSSS